MGFYIEKDMEIEKLREQNARLKKTLADQDAMVEEAAYDLTAAVRAALMDEMHDHALTIDILTRERDEAREYITAYKVATEENYKLLKEQLDEARANCAILPAVVEQAAVLEAEVARLRDGIRHDTLEWRKQQRAAEAKVAARKTDCDNCEEAFRRSFVAEAEVARLREALEDMVRVSGVAIPSVRRASCERAMEALAAAKGE